MSRRALDLAAASVLAATSLIVILRVYQGPNCIEDIEDLVRLFWLPCIFSLAVVWIMSEPISLVISAARWRPLAARSAALLLALVVHFSIGAVGWAISPDVPEAHDRGPNAVAWIPFWIVGVLYRAGHYSYFLCQ